MQPDSLAFSDGRFNGIQAIEEIAIAKGLSNLNWVSFDNGAVKLCSHRVKQLLFRFNSFQTADKTVVEFLRLHVSLVLGLRVEDVEGSR